MSASKMRSLSWDWGLARGCQRLAENGDLNHYIHPLLNNKSSDVGQNLYLGAGTYTNFWVRYSIRGYFSFLLKKWNWMILILRAINSWYTENKYFAYGEGSVTGKYKFRLKLKFINILNHSWSWTKRLFLRVFTKL